VCDLLYAVVVKRLAVQICGFEQGQADGLFVSQSDIGMSQNSMNNAQDVALQSSIPTPSVA
jgi:hypothetical protein